MEVQYRICIQSSSPPHKMLITKRCFLWIILLLQIFLIYCFWLLQYDTKIDSSTEKIPQFNIDYRKWKRNEKERVNFITKAFNNTNPNYALSLKANARLGKKYKEKNSTERIQMHLNKEFILTTNRLITTNYSNNNNNSSSEKFIYCFRDGTEIGVGEEEEVNCKCKYNWHGKDCGQPEVIWRALMTTKLKYHLQLPYKNEPHGMFYIIEGYFFNIDILELIIKTVENVVDYFLLFYKNMNAKSKDLNRLEHKLNEILLERNFIIFHCSLIASSTCTISHAFRYFQKILRNDNITTRSKDLFIYASDEEILSFEALKFFKYYIQDIKYVKFRLKYNVYGFYWEHPNKTYVSGLLSSFKYLKNTFDNHIRLLQSASIVEKDDNVLTIGNLNHFGGWYCKYCQQPDEIISQMRNDLSLLKQLQFPNINKNHVINTNYIQQLIATGRYVDGWTNLIKIRSYNNMYYAPQYTEGNKWKYGYLLINLFESLNDDLEENEYY